MTLEKSELWTQYDMYKTEELLERYFSGDLTESARETAREALESRGITPEQLDEHESRAREIESLERMSVSLEEEKKWPEMRACNEKILALSPDPDMKAKALVNIMVAYENEGDFEKAAAAGQEASRLAADEELKGFIVGRLARLKFEDREVPGVTVDRWVLAVSVFTILTIIAYMFVLATWFIDGLKEYGDIAWGAAIFFTLVVAASSRYMKSRR